MNSKLEDHLLTFRITTADVLAEAALDGDVDQAQAVLRELAKTRSMVRRDRLYVARPLVEDEAELQKAFAVFHYCCLQRPRRRLIPREDIEKVLQPIMDAGGGPLPKETRCYIDRDKRMSMLRVQPLPKSEHEGEVNLALHSLQQAVETQVFRPFANLATEGGFSITYLMRVQERAAELRLWTKRRPLVSPLASEPVVIPLIVAVVPRLAEP